jgi:hypothetical protein
MTHYNQLLNSLSVNAGTLHVKHRKSWINFSMRHNYFINLIG